MSPVSRVVGVDEENRFDIIYVRENGTSAKRKWHNTETIIQRKFDINCKLNSTYIMLKILNYFHFEYSLVKYPMNCKSLHLKQSISNNIFFNNQ